MRILITGSTGFVGRHLLITMKNLDYDVFHLVRSGKNPEREFLWDHNSSVPSKIPACDVVVHLAAYVDFLSKLEVEQYKVNTLSTLQLANWCRKTGSRLALASTVGIHGNQNHVGSGSPIQPSSDYGMSKYLAEEVASIVTNDVVILRIGGIYGLQGPKHLGLNRAITDAYHRSLSPTLSGSELAKRNYICVWDVASWIAYEVSESASRHPEVSKQKIVRYLSGPEILSITAILNLK